MIDGGTGNDSIFGGAGNDSILGGAGNDILDGGSGADTIYANEGNDTADGGGNNDTFYISSDLGNLPNSIDGGVDDGGAGDTMVLQGLVDGGSYDLTTLANVTDNMETLDIRDGVDTEIVFTSQDIQNMVDDGASSVLTIMADSGDTLTFAPDVGESMAPGFTPGVDATYTISNGGQIAQIQWDVA